MSGERLANPDQYASGLETPRVLSSDQAGGRSGLVRRWTGGSGEISQPPIDHPYVVLHLGGPKPVTHGGGVRTLSASVGEGALTLAPTGGRDDCITVDPIDFDHLYVHRSRLSSLIASRYDRNAIPVTSDEKIGFDDLLLAQSGRTGPGARAM